MLFHFLESGKLSWTVQLKADFQQEGKMKKRKYFYSLYVSASIILLGSMSLNAQEVRHHDNMVDVDEPKICFSCHYGTIDKQINPCKENNCLLTHETSHPVFNRYPPAGKESKFSPSSKVEAAGIKLKGGGVTCVSCHDLMNQRDYHLVIDNEKGRLCKICHIR